MDDLLDERIASLSEPRVLDEGFRARLERALIQAAGGPAAASGPSAGWRIDGPREPTAPFRARLERAIVRRRAPTRPLVARMAAAIAALLVASTVMVVTDRVGSPRGEGSGPLLSAPTVAPSRPTPPAAAPPGSLHAFGSAGEFLRYVRAEALKITGPGGINPPGIYRGGVAFGRGPITGPIAAPGSGGPGAPVPQPLAPATGGGRYSTTNVQEVGVDEPDIVKTDGDLLAVLQAGKLSVLDVTRGRARLEGSLKVDGSGVGAFLSGDRVIVFTQLFEAPPEARPATHATARPWTKVTVVDVANPARPKVQSAFEVEGSYVGARMVGGIVRLVIQSGALGPQPAEIKKYTPAGYKTAEAANKVRIKASFVGDWLPHYVVQKPGGGTATGHVHDWSAVSRPPDRAGVSMLTILTIDPADPRPDNAQSVVGAGEIVYSSTKNLYVTSYRLDDVLAIQKGVAPEAPVTRIHKFDISDPNQTRYVGSGEVVGFLLNQFSISEHGGHLRVASTLGARWLGTGASASESAVTVLRERAGKLVRVGSIDGLGIGEQIFSVRFIGNKAYVVTFRQIDPLYVVDLRTPTRPRVVGKLKVPGYSGYLHPLSETLLLGVGRDADKSGRTGGVQFSLFDVSNPAKPRRLAAKVVGEQGASSVEYDHHGFLYWAPERLTVVPVELWDGSGSHQFVGALALTVSSKVGFGEPNRLTHMGRPHTGLYPQILRSLVIGNRLLTVSNDGVLVSDLDSFADKVWVALRH